MKQELADKYHHDFRNSSLGNCDWWLSQIEQLEPREVTDEDIIHNLDFLISEGDEMSKIELVERLKLMRNKLTNKI